MVDVTGVVARYSPINPVYSDIISNLVDGGLYTKALAASEAVDVTKPGNILQYKNGAGVSKSAVALEVIADSISKAILKQLRDGFSNSLDSAINVNLNASNSINVNIQLDDNVHSALIKLSNEVAALHTTMATVFSALGQGEAITTMETAIQTANASVLSVPKINL